MLQQYCFSELIRFCWLGLALEFCIGFIMVGDEQGLLLVMVSINLVVSERGFPADLNASIGTYIMIWNPSG